MSPALFSAELGDLDACKKKCLTFGKQCMFIVHGWRHGASKWCGVWRTFGVNGVHCKSLDQGPHDCGSSGNNGVHSYEYIDSRAHYCFIESF